MSFPVEIIIDILLRLPAKSLIRFKSVCKSWYELINGVDFVNRHLERSLATQTNLHFVYNAHDTLCMADFDSFNKPIELNYPFRDSVMVVGSFNGLLCLQSSNQRPLVIYNPTTQTYKKLPLLGKSASFDHLRSMWHFGFGYDSIARDYKCVSVIQCGNGNGYRMGPFENEVMVYSLKDDSWRKARTPSVPFNFGYRRNVFVNDSIHWVGGVNENVAIVAFDLRDETFSTLPIPDCDSLNRRGMYVGILDGCLCLSISYNELRDSDIWVMREYGVAGSWTKLFSIAKRNGHDAVERPVCYSINLKELFVHMSFICEVASINLDTMEISIVKGPDFNFCTNAHVCVENLLMLEDSNCEWT
ncbi:hypothetical protein SOVF_089980 [Spinacia oleracea]|uniref:F-box protein CPR1-like n=1 Tax=Spinacia oleracea TaxID=3562 RepID=A0A9R0IR47_SPIOL|nr:F-box protein CPR1-like [Spinacia oleracea]KNA16347.1 hypothetical protein SOVF_089980 [Spinacia oleracea]